MDSSGHQDLAARLMAAYTDGPIDPPSAAHPQLSLEDAYAVQTLQVERWCASGRAVVGHKVGLTSAAMQRQLSVNEPDYGVLFADMAHDDGGEVAASGFLQPRIEPEIAFVLDRDLSGPGVTMAAAARAIGFVLPALEIIDSRVRDWQIAIADTIADNASSAGFVLGGRPTSVAAHDLRLVGATLTADGALVGTGAGGAVLGSPLVALVWLANTLGARGMSLHEGDIVLPGSVMAAQPVKPGQTWTATFAALGSVTIEFARASS